MRKDISKIKWQALTFKDTLNQLQVDSGQGLSIAEVSLRQKIYSPNQITTNGGENIIKRFFRQFHNALIYILLVTIVIAFYLNQIVDASVILAVVMINAVFGFLQEGKAEKALQAIRNMLAPQAKVIRDGKRMVVAAEDLVPGDIVIINRGDKVPADLRLYEVKNLQIDESILTGESLPVEKNIMHNPLAHSGALVVDGRGVGVVIATGKDTELGKITEALSQVETIDTPLLRQMNHFGKWLTVVIIGIALIVFLVGALVWHDLSSKMFMAIVGLTVAAVPEGLPPVITIILAIGVTRMAKNKAIVRRLPAVETMGTVTTICTDKTGTLTCNKLKVQSVITATRRYLVGDNNLDLTSNVDLRTGIEGVVLCNDAEPYCYNNICEAYGSNPIDVALMNLAFDLNPCEDCPKHNSKQSTQSGINPKLLKQKYFRLDLIPYETEHKFMATLNRDHEWNSLISIKGAPEIILDRCSMQMVDGKLHSLEKNYWQENIEQLASLGERLIAFAIKRVSNHKTVLNFSDVDNDLVLVALFGLADPPRAEAIAAVQESINAGITVKMITGDHAVTAKTIAGKVGIDNSEVLTGDLIDEMSNKELQNIVKKVNVYARTTPYHKLRLVKALQAQGEVVAMTGDGVNDAPALKQADIGVAMGKKGADIAKESSEMVLADDNFATIVSAIHEGRTIYDNLKKSILFILPVSFAQAFAVIVAVLFGLTLPITPVQILWVNMITAITLCLALGFEKAESDIMNRLPRDSKSTLLSWHLMWRVFSVSLIMTAVIFGAFGLVNYRGFDLEIAQTVAVNVLVVSEILYLINCRNLKRSSLNFRAFFGSKPVWISIGVMILLQFFFTYITFMQNFFGTESIGFVHWGYIVLAAAIAFLLIELEKRFKF